MAGTTGIREQETPKIHQGRSGSFFVQTGSARAERLEREKRFLSFKTVAAMGLGGIRG